MIPGKLLAKACWYPLLLSPLLVFILFISCKSTDQNEGTPAVAGKVVTLDSYTPTKGGPSTVLTLRGSHFGIDPDNVQVTLNGVVAPVNTMNDTVITATVPLNAGSGPLKVAIGKFPDRQVLAYPTNFQYEANWALGDFIRPSGVNPVISPLLSEFYCPMRKAIVKWEESDTFNPAAVVKDGKIVVLYRAEDNSAQGIGKRTSRIGYAESTDGLTMARRDAPVLYPAEDANKTLEWEGGCEDPRVAVTSDGLYVMFYTAWNRTVARLAVATSRDLVNWEKHGLAFGKAYNGRFEGLACKSASIVTKIEDGKQVITKVNGKYLMYWGENPVAAATSDDLVNWAPVLDEQMEIRKLAIPRKGYFDSRLTECGPPAVMTDQGIILLYNGKNDLSDANRDPAYAAGAYCAGQMLFDKQDPYRLIARLDKPFFYPKEDFEKSGQYTDGTVFTEGLVYFQSKWFLYYGAADSRVGVAVYDPRAQINK